MPKPPDLQRAQHGKPGRIDLWPDGFPPLAEIANKVLYRGNGKHKTYPAPNREWIPSHNDEYAKCDKVPEEEWHKLSKVLSDAICAGCVQLDPACDFPARAWAFVNGILHEARRANRDAGEYHAFPLTKKSQWPHDPHDLLKGAPRVRIPTL